MFTENVQLASQELMVNLRLALSVWLTSPFLLIRRSSLTTLLTNLGKWQPVPSVNKPPPQRKLLFRMFPESFCVHPSFLHQLCSSVYWQYDERHNYNKFVWPYNVLFCSLKLAPFSHRALLLKCLVTGPTCYLRLCDITLCHHAAILARKNCCCCC